MPNIPRLDLGAGVDHPLLSSESPPQTPTRLRRPRRIWLRRWMRPLLILLVPPLIFIAYTLITPHFPNLPAVPKVKIQVGDGPPPPEPQIVDRGSCICGETDRGRQICDVYHEQGLRTSRLVQSSGARTRRLLNRAREGQEVKIGILGGSVSACRGVHPSPQYPEGDPAGPGCYTSILKDWFQDTFPTAAVHLQNGAIGGSDSGYYAFCGTHHIPTDADLIILEFDVNDQSDLIYQEFFDQLIRVLLEFESQPAIVILGSWAPQVAQDQGYGDPQIVHLPMATYYDIPYISLKRLIFNHYTRFPQSTAQTFWLPDQLHPNARGHRVLGDLLIGYLETELCMLSRYGLPVVPPEELTIATANDVSSLIDVKFDVPQPVRVDGVVDWTKPPDGWEATFDPGLLESIGTEKRHFALPQTPYSLPFVTMFTPLRNVIDPHKPDPATPAHILELVQPDLFCADANDKQHPMQPTTHDGWSPYAWNGEKHYWVSSTVGAKIRVDIKVNAGRVAVYYFRSAHYDLGDALCWVDDNEKGAVRLIGHWTKTYNMAVVSYIDQNVTTGAHYVTCQVAEESSHPENSDAHHFRIVAVMAT